MKAVRDNKVYNIDETSKSTYLAQGFDITDDHFNIIERSPAATVPYTEYQKVKNELEELKAQKAKK